jgi:hypothetical protein
MLMSRPSSNAKVRAVAGLSPLKHANLNVLGR